MIIPYSGTVEYVFTELFHDKFAVSVFKVGHALAIDHTNFIEAMNDNFEISSIWNMNFV